MHPEQSTDCSGLFCRQGANTFPRGEGICAAMRPTAAAHSPTAYRSLTIVILYRYKIIFIVILYKMPVIL